MLFLNINIFNKEIIFLNHKNLQIKKFANKFKKIIKLVA